MKTIHRKKPYLYICRNESQKSQNRKEGNKTTGFTPVIRSPVKDGTKEDALRVSRRLLDIIFVIFNRGLAPIFADEFFLPQRL
jgi:hypothetical protein